ncbi:MAG: alpha/beta hydrolase [Pseudomonas sp.]|uniref:alpha/beta hydrolase n=1 Tax=Pseudomonas sp. TaxID=306 RepID=UPI003396D47B
MTSFVELPVPLSTGQRLLTGLLRLTLKVIFRGLVRPWMPVAGQRAVLRLLACSSRPPAQVSIEPGFLADRPCEWHRPPAPSSSVLLYLHGGAYLIGSPTTHRNLAAHLALRCGLLVCVLDYRRAPESPYPAALDDVVAAYQALLAQGYSASQVLIGGDSAGGHLALISALRLPALGLPRPAALLCFSPLTDASASALHRPAAGDPVLHPSWVRQGLSAFCPPLMERQDPRLSPLNDDLTALPPLLIQVGEDEILRDDSLRLAERVRAAGGEVRLERYPGFWHVFQSLAGRLNAADLALGRVAAFVQQRGL